MTTNESQLPRIGLTMGDVAGIGPEVIARALGDTSLYDICQPVVIGNLEILKRALALIGNHEIETRALSSLSDEEELVSAPGVVFCFDPMSTESSKELVQVPEGQLDGRAGEAAYHYLTAAISSAQAGEIDGITTAPLNKAALHLAGHHYPGHTEILAEKCGVEQFAMMLFLPPGKIVRGEQGLAVSHVTLHTSIKSVPGLLTQEEIENKIELTYRFMEAQGCAEPRIGVCALNPHAGEEGLFGDEEAELIQPAVESARKKLGGKIAGPYPADTLLNRTVVKGEFDGVVAMYHDQGHIALKLIAFDTAVNVTLGLPIVRTSPSHGTGFDIAWKGQADSSGMIEAIRTAVNLVHARKNSST